MGFLADALNFFDRIPLWKRVKDLPDQVHGLSERVRALEEKYNGTWPPDVCRYCGERAARLWNANPGAENGMKKEDWRCASCGKIEPRFRKII